MRKANEEKKIGEKSKHKHTKKSKLRYKHYNGAEVTLLARDVLVQRSTLKNVLIANKNCSAQVTIGKEIQNLPAKKGSKQHNGSSR